MSRHWCPVCEIEMNTSHKWLHEKTKSHKAKVDERFPLPPSPWRTDLETTEIKKLPAKTPHLGYLTKKA